jgi:hypothetical protein
LRNLPPAINVWRHELNWLGGMGIIVLAVAILPLLGVGGMQLYKAEATGINKDSKLTAQDCGYRQGVVAGVSLHHSRMHCRSKVGWHELAGCCLSCFCRYVVGRILDLRLRASDSSIRR